MPGAAGRARRERERRAAGDQRARAAGVPRLYQLHVPADPSGWCLAPGAPISDGVACGFGDLGGGSRDLDGRVESIWPILAGFAVRRIGDFCSLKDRVI